MTAQQQSAQARQRWLTASVLLVCTIGSGVLLLALCGAAPATESWVRLGADGKLIYRAAARGNRITDFSEVWKTRASGDRGVVEGDGERAQEVHLFEWLDEEGPAFFGDLRPALVDIGITAGEDAPQGGVPRL